MRFLLDVHIAASIGRALTDQGHDVLRASQTHADWLDSDLLELAVSQQRVLVTEDRDFSDLVYRGGVAAPPAILYLRCGPSDQRDMAERVLLILANTRVDDHMVVIQRASVRIRPLPEKSNCDG